MGFTHVILSASALILLGSLPVLAETKVPVSEPADTWECPTRDGGTIYTNKEEVGCREVLLKPLSVVPSVENMSVAPMTSTTGALQYDMPLQLDRTSAMAGETAPGWAQDWYMSMAPGGSVAEEVCGLYSEWLHLAQKTRGGLFQGSDPSYGGDVTGRNQLGASHSFYDNARWAALSRIFGTGFVPVGCL